MDELDPEISKMFAAARPPLADDQFIATVLATIDRTRRARLLRRILVLAVAASIVFANVPLLEKTASLLGSAGAFFSDYMQFLITPWGWALSMVIGAYVLLRTRPSRR